MSESSSTWKGLGPAPSQAVGGEIRITSASGGQKGSKLEQWSLVDPDFREAAINLWPDNPEKRIAFTMLDFEQGDCPAKALVSDGIALLAYVCGNVQNAVSELAQLYGFGTRKYDRGNWRKGYEYSLSIDAFWRHLLHARERDEESGLLHAAAVLWHCYCLRDFEERGVGVDDRLYKRGE